MADLGGEDAFDGEDQEVTSYNVRCLPLPREPMSRPVTPTPLPTLTTLATFSLAKICLTRLVGSHVWLRRVCMWCDGCLFNDANAAPTPDAASKKVCTYEPDTYGVLRSSSSSTHARTHACHIRRLLLSSHRSEVVE